MEDEQDDPKEFKSPQPGGFFYVGWVIAVILLMVATGGLVLARERWLSHQTTELQHEAESGPHVLVSQVLRAPETRVLRLPATVRGFDETDIYAKVPGYLKAIYVDKGDRVRNGQLLAKIESPETDQQVANFRANYELARVTFERDKVLYRTGVIAKQDYDNQNATMLQAKATLEQYKMLQGYEVVRAPFDGIITARNVDPGHLIPAATGATSTTSSIVSLARLKPLRVFSYLPQSVTPFIKNGDHATITVNEYPGRNFEGSVTRHPEALAPDSRTMLVEVDLPNDDHALYPGMYGMAEFVVSVAHGAPMVSDDALIFRNNKVYVPVVRDNRLHLAEVKLGYDNGVAVQITSGVNFNDLVALNVGQAAREGAPVQPVHADQTNSEKQEM
ncbi:MAG TPA: efflux RND transporter periplasmic adaptor subunit [Candidatus Binataceae bacterium]|nr:efflux RND transporter periplasmic adaptor subunit [Candidatus Binataceae bacterium]